MGKALRSPEDEQGLFLGLVSSGKGLPYASQEMVRLCQAC